MAKVLDAATKSTLLRDAVVLVLGRTAGVTKLPRFFQSIKRLKDI